MVVVFQCVDPYIASRHGEETCVAFEGSKKECEMYLLNEFIDHESRVFSRVCDAVRYSNRRGNFDGLYRDGSGSLYLRYDSRVWEIMQKREACDSYGLVTLTARTGRR
jgi:hypothetical protein